MSLLDRSAIAARVPHAGPMCLLDSVLSWDEQGIECAAAVRAVSAHPLACDGRVPATAVIEYAAQAMALHGRLVQEQAGAAAAPRRGFLAALRFVRLHCRWVDVATTSLTVRASRFAGDEVQVLYDFEVEAAGPIAAGRAVVVLDASARDPAPAGAARP